MVKPSPVVKRLRAMCIPTVSDVPHGMLARRHTMKHNCVFKILACSPKQLCIFCFLFCYFATGNCLEASNNDFRLPKEETKPPSYSLHCTSNTSCTLKILSNEQALWHMIAASEQLFNQYSNKSTQTIDKSQLEEFVSDVGLMEEESHEGHAHEDHEIHAGHDHEAHENHEGHDHSHDKSLADPAYDDFFNSLWPDFEDGHNEEQEEVDSSRRKRSADDIQCISSMKELVKNYFLPRPSEEASLTLGDFITLMPQILLDIRRPECRMEKESSTSHEEPTDVPEQSTAKIWLISFGSVAIISLVSLLGVLLIPLLRHSSVLNQLIAFLVALAVGTLSGDALLHLLPHANGDHDHSTGHEGHNHGDEEDHFASMWKGLVACAGIYVFYLLETIMGLVHRRKVHGKAAHNHSHHHNHCGDVSPVSSSPSKEPKSNKDDVTVMYSPTPSQSPLLNGNAITCEGTSNGSDVTVSYSPTPNQSPVLNGNAIMREGRSNGSVHKASSDSSAVPLINVNGAPVADHRHENGTRLVIDMDEAPLETGHHHHSHDVPKTIASLAWMVIVGDGLHNITDGLAIGAAFTSGIGPGLGTSLAIFFHEIPQELGDFAILLNAGMSVKQALLCNFLSALSCFVGLIIGLIVGEYTSGIILWILAFTAGGFLYIALVDMLPAMIKQLEHKDYLKRLLIQNAGMICGFGIMVVIALREESFTSLF